jgi:hypothetical protein
MLVKNGFLNAADTATINNEMKFTFSKDVAYKDDLGVLNIVAAIAQDGWKRPIYFGAGMGDNYQGMNDYMRLEGSVYRLCPYKSMLPHANNPGDMGYVDAQKSFDLFTKTYYYGNADRKNVYFDEKNRMMLTAYRIDAARVADELSAIGRKEDAVKVLDKVIAGITPESYAYDVPAYYMAISYYRAGAKEKAKKFSFALAKNMEDDIKYSLDLDDNLRDGMASDVQRDLTIINILSNVSGQMGDTAASKELGQKFQGLLQACNGKINLQQGQGQ